MFNFVDYLGQQFSNVKNWWYGEGQKQQQDSEVVLPLDEKSDKQTGRSYNWNWYAKQAGKGALVLGTGVVAYLGISALFGKKNKEDLTANEFNNDDKKNKLDFYNSDHGFSSAKYTELLPVSSFAAQRTLLNIPETKSEIKEKDDLVNGDYYYLSAQENKDNKGLEEENARTTNLIYRGIKEVKENVQDGYEFQINTHTERNQYYPAVTVLNNGNFVVVWQSSGQDVGDNEGTFPHGIYGQRYSSTGIMQGSEFHANTFTTGEQQYPSVAKLLNGGFVVTWESYVQYGIFGQRYDSIGIPQGGEFQVTPFCDGQKWPSVEGLTGGGFVVVWQAVGDGDNAGIFGRRFNSTGGSIGTEFQVNTFTTGNQEKPKVTSLAGGGFVVVWQSKDQDGDNYGIYGQRFDSVGSPQGSEFQANTYTTANQGMYGFDVTGLSTGDFVVTWTSGDYGYSGTQDGDDYGIFARRYNSVGVPQGNEFQVNTYTAGYQNMPSITSLSDGGFVIAWVSEKDGGNTGIYGQRYNAIGEKIGNEFQASTYTIGGMVPSVAGFSSNADFVVTWSRGDAHMTGVYGRTSWGPALVANELVINEGETIPLDLSILNANRMGADNSVVFNFTVRNVQHGYFDKVTNQGVAITSFTRQEIIDNQIRFVHNGDELEPSYEVMVSDGTTNTNYHFATIVFTNINDMPVLVNNTLTISTGKTVTLDRSNLGATDVELDDASLTFYVTNVNNGRFAEKNYLGQSILQFTQQKIFNEQIVFIHDEKKGAPSYDVKVSDGTLETPYYPANITFHKINQPAVSAWIIIGISLTGLTCAATTLCIMGAVLSLYLKTHKNVKNIKAVEVELADLVGKYEKIESRIYKLDVELTKQKNIENGLCSLVRKEISGSEKEIYEKLLARIKETQSQEINIFNIKTGSTEQLREELIKVSSIVQNLQQKKIENSELKQKVDDLVVKQKLLMNDYLHQQLLLHKKKYINEYPELLAFYRRVQLKLTELFLACKVINSGLVERKDDTFNEAVEITTQVTQGLISLGDSILSFVPGMGIITKTLEIGTSAVSKVATELYNKKEEVIIKKLSELTANLNEMDSLIEEVAERLTFRYEAQIRCLTVAKQKEGASKVISKSGLTDDKKDGGAEKLAECAVGRMLDAMRSGNVSFDKDDNLVNQLVDVVFYSDPKKSLFTKTKIEAKSNSGIEKWNGKGIFQKAGLKVLDKKTGECHYYQGFVKKGQLPLCTMPEEYGYRLGNEEEVKTLKLGRQDEREENPVDRVITTVYKKPTPEQLLSIGKNNISFFGRGDTNSSDTLIKVQLSNI